MRGAARTLSIAEQAQVGLRHAEVEHCGKSLDGRVSPLEPVVRLVENSACVGGTSTREKQPAQPHLCLAPMNGVPPPIERRRSRAEHALGSGMSAGNEKTLTFSQHGAGTAVGKRRWPAICRAPFRRVQDGNRTGWHSLQRARLPDVRTPDSQKGEREPRRVA